MQFQAYSGAQAQSAIQRVINNVLHCHGAVLALALLMQPAMAQAMAEDPWPGLNRQVYRFNRVLDGYLVKPVALTYDKVVPRIAKRGVSNFFNNLDDINVVVNDLLQFKFHTALQDSGRLALNSTVGVAGLFDVATHFGLHKNSEDFGQTLGHWGVPHGGYVVLPLLGSSTIRDAIGLVPDLLLNPVFWVNDSKTRTIFYALDTIDTRLTYIAAESMIRGDEYIFVRDAYLQRRAYLVADGEVYDEFDDF